jgi:hypothetical protein
VIELKKEDVFQAFFAAGLEGDYNFLEDDLMKLANAFVAMAAPAIVKEERAECVKFAKSLNHLVGEALQVKRNSL